MKNIPVTIDEAKSALKKLANPSRAKLLQRFFKTGPGEYAEGDIFLGIPVPEIRKVAMQYDTLSLTETLNLLRSPLHEERLTAIFILISQYQKGDDATRKEIYRAYLKNTRHINNWDLIDLSAGHIVGHFLFDKDKAILYHLAKSKSLWERRIAVLSIFYFIKYRRFGDAFKISKILLNDEEDLIHKAVGWMLREAGKRNQKAEEIFLKRYYKKMPRTMLRYAIERFPENLRQAYLQGIV